MGEFQTASYRGRWRVFVEGVEVPHVGLSLTAGLDQVSTLQVYLTPHESLHHARPNAMVHVFRDVSWDYDKGNEEENTLLAWEGMSVGLESSRSRTARHVILRCESLLSILGGAQAFMSGLGVLPFTPTVSGSVLFPILPENAVLGPVIGLSSLLGAFAKDTTGIDIPGRDAESPDFSQRVLRVIHEIATNNMAVRQAVVRTRMLDKLAALGDKTLGGMLSTRAVTALIKDMPSGLSEHSTLLEIVERLLSYAFYHHTTCLFPHRPNFDLPEGYKHPRLTTGSAIPGERLRNDILLLPETYALLPPACNIIFYHQLESVSTSRNYANEPTRLFMVDPIADSVVMSPSALSEATAGMGFRTGGKPSTGESNTGTAIFYKGLDDRELEKGIVSRVVVSEFENFAGSLSVGITSPSSVQDKTVKSLDSLTGASEWSRSVQAVSDYKLNIAKFERAGQVQVRGAQFLVPGLPTIIHDSDAVLFAQVTGVTINVDPSGQETTTAMLDKVRPAPEGPIEDKVKEIDYALKNLDSLVLDVVDKSGNIDADSLGIEDPSSILSALSLAMLAIDDLNAKVTNAIEKSFVDPQTASPDLLLFEPTNTISGTPEQIEAVLVAAAATDDVYSFARGLVTRLSRLAASNEQVAASAPQFKTFADDIKRLAFWAGDGDTLSVDDIDVLSLLEVSFPENLSPLLRPGIEPAVQTDILPPIRIVNHQTVHGEPQMSVPQDFASIRKDLLWSVGLDSGHFFSTERKDDSKPLLQFSRGTYIARVGYSEIALTGQLKFALARTMQSLQSAFSEGYADAVSDLVEESRVQSIESEVSAISAQIQDMSLKLGMPVPPRSISQGVSSLEDVDELYSGLIGASPIYASSSTIPKDVSAAIDGIASSLDLPSGTESVVESLKNQARSIANFVHGSTYLAELLGFGGFDGEWEERRNNGEDVARWAHDNFHKRDTTTMADWRTDNGLVLSRFSVQGKEFLRFKVPDELATKITGADGETRLWDDSLFCKLVDDAGIGSGSTDIDEGVAARRADVSSGILTTKERQEPWVAYVKAIGGTRAFRTY